MASVDAPYLVEGPCVLKSVQILFSTSVSKAERVSSMSAYAIKKWDYSARALFRIIPEIWLSMLSTSQELANISLARRKMGLRQRI